VSDPIYVLAGGGTGGHLYPGLAVAERLIEAAARARIVFACSSRPIDRRILEPTDYAIVPQAIQPMPRRFRGWGKFLMCWLGSARQAADLIGELRPAAVLGLGGFAAAPLVRRAARAAVPTAILNPDAAPGIANRHLARSAEVIFTQFHSTQRRFGSAGRAKIRCVGCPIGDRFGRPGRAEAVEHFGLDPGRRTLLVVGGSSGAASINQAIAALAEELDGLAETWQLLHVHGPGQPSGPSPRKMQVRTLEYCRRMDLAYAAADLALTRAGAVTVAELAATGTPAVLMPYPYAGGHQALNAADLAAAGAAVVVADAADASANAESLRRQMMALLSREDTLADMSRAARRLAKPDAAVQVARWLAGRGD